MSLKLPLLSRSPINFAAAKNTDDNIIAPSKQYHDTLDFYQTLFDKKDAIYDIVRFQLGLDPYRDNCHVSPHQEWMRGKFNVCVPISVNSRQFCGRVLMRFPLPHMFRGEAQNPSGSTSSTGSIDDKDQHHHDVMYRQTLFRGLARLMLSLARLPQPRIGSFIFDPDDCIVTLGHRPLTCVAMLRESEEMKRKQRKVRALSGSFIEPYQRNGPFVIQMTDLHQSNIFVDEAWNITCLVDLEWACSLPAEMLTIPPWLANPAVDEPTGENLQHDERIRSEFLTIIKQEQAQGTGRNTIADLMQKTWESGGAWFWFSLCSVNVMIYLVRDHFAPLYSIQLSRETNELLSKLWCRDLSAMVEHKVREQEVYQRDLSIMFKTDC
ncbi:hypothetical protein BBAD15_g6706 [Beauveria bassiana D1-5]|uniref:Aminoglycoside phosphotransferase domain-containing protein n=1 Tax=Beauveria bassiana D1-5 TaxID=1245745 RepID=A0A0A2VP66_BEABA|nr:hypothetical protein BBAD15_g6706 [Beauveria bassiana D1-5]